MGLFKRFFRDVRKAAGTIGTVAGFALGGPAGAALGGAIGSALAPSPRRQARQPTPPPTCPAPAQQPIPPGFRSFGTTFRSGRFPPQLDPGFQGAGAFPQALVPGQVAGSFFQQPVQGAFQQAGIQPFAPQFGPPPGFQQFQQFQQQPFQQQQFQPRGGFFQQPRRSAFGFGF